MIHARKCHGGISLWKVHAAIYLVLLKCICVKNVIVVVCFVISESNYLELSPMSVLTEDACDQRSSKT